MVVSWRRPVYCFCWLWFHKDLRGHFTFPSKKLMTEEVKRCQVCPDIVKNAVKCIQGFQDWQKTREPFYMCKISIWQEINHDWKPKNIHRCLKNAIIIKLIFTLVSSGTNLMYWTPSRIKVSSFVIIFSNLSTRSTCVGHPVKVKLTYLVIILSKHRYILSQDQICLEHPMKTKATSLIIIFSKLRHNLEES